MKEREETMGEGCENMGGGVGTREEEWDHGRHRRVTLEDAPRGRSQGKREKQEGHMKEGYTEKQRGTGGRNHEGGEQENR